jgi:hypothetical protein
MTDRLDQILVPGVLLIAVLAWLWGFRMGRAFERVKP